MIRSRLFAQTVLSFICAAERMLHAAPESEPVRQVVGVVSNGLRAVITQPIKSIRLADGIFAKTIVFRHTEWQLKNMPQSALLSSKMESEALALPEGERLKIMDRLDDY